MLFFFFLQSVSLEKSFFIFTFISSESISQVHLIEKDFIKSIPKKDFISIIEKDNDLFEYKIKIEGFKDKQYELKFYEEEKLIYFTEMFEFNGENIKMHKNKENDIKMHKNNEDDNDLIFDDQHFSLISELDSEERDLKIENNRNLIYGGFFVLGIMTLIIFKKVIKK